MIDPGVMRHRVVVETPTDVRNAVGETSQTWATYATRWANVQPITYSEQSRRGQIGGSTSYQVNLRYLSGLTASMRIVWPARDNVVLYISSVVEVGNKEGHELTCEAVA